jgi:hypothetical protein
MGIKFSVALFWSVAVHIMACSLHASFACLNDRIFVELVMKKVILAFAMSVALPGLAMAQTYPQTPESAMTQDQLNHMHDHLEHDRQHQQIEDAHAREHASGFTSEAQHQEYHKQLNGIHGDVHDNLPGTEHAHDDASYNGRSNGDPRQGYRQNGDRDYSNRNLESRTVRHSVHHRYGRAYHHHTTTIYHHSSY